jgi:RecA-family ATPase
MESDWLRDVKRRRAAKRANRPPRDAEPPERLAMWFRAAVWAGRPVPPREWHVADLIPARTVTMLGGDGGTGKSLVALMLACSTALGRPWLRRAVRQGGALYLSAEDDDDELHRRVAAILTAEGASFADLDNLTIRSLAGEDALLAIPDPKTGVLHPTPLFHELDERIGDEQPALVGLDTLADLHSGQENDRATARQLIGILRGLAIRHDCAVLLLAHPSLTGMATGSGLSGSTAWNASVRSRLYLDRVVVDGHEADPDRRVLRTVKTNYGRTGGEIGLTWREGVFVADEAETSLDRTAASAKSERVFLKLLDMFTARGQRLNPVSGPTFAPARFAEHPEAEGVTKRAFKSAMEALFSRGALAIQHEGPPSKRVTFIVRGAE